MIKVYTASKLSMAEEWRQLEKEWPHVIFHARWLRHNYLGTPDLPQYAARFWLEDELDIKASDAVLIYAKPGEVLKGALVEAGIAIAARVPILVVGHNGSYGTWQFHPGVTRVASLHDARDWLLELDKKLGLSQTEHLHG